MGREELPGALDDLVYDLRVTPVLIYSREELLAFRSELRDYVQWLDDVLGES